MQMGQRNGENNHQIVSGPRFSVIGIVTIWHRNRVMQRSFICSNGHSFIVFDKVEGSPQETVRKIYFGVHCPLCSSICEIDWPSSRTFRLVAIDTLPSEKSSPMIDVTGHGAH